MLAADKERAIPKAADEDDATVLLETQLVRALGVGLDVGPFRSFNFARVEKLVVATSAYLPLVLLVLGGKETSGISWKIITLVVPILKTPRIYAELFWGGENIKAGLLAAE
jgi:hypothetical protein